MAVGGRAARLRRAERVLRQAPEVLLEATLAAAARFPEVEEWERAAVAVVTQLAWPAVARAARPAAVRGATRGKREAPAWPAWRPKICRRRVSFRSAGRMAISF